MLNAELLKFITTLRRVYLDNRKKFGAYLVDTGENFGLKNCITSSKYYVVHETTKVAIGMYAEEQLAINLAIGLEKRDQLFLSEEIEKMLIKSSETSEN